MHRHREEKRNGEEWALFSSPTFKGNLVMILKLIKAVE